MSDNLVTHYGMGALGRIRELEALLKECEEAILEARRIIDPNYPQRAWDWQANAENVLIKLRMRKNDTA